MHALAMQNKRAGTLMNTIASSDVTLADWFALMPVRSEVRDGLEAWQQKKCRNGKLIASRKLMQRFLEGAVVGI
jgi:hypothetical protein